MFQLQSQLLFIMAKLRVMMIALRLLAIKYQGFASTTINHTKISVHQLINVKIFNFLNAPISIAGTKDSDPFFALIKVVGWDGYVALCSTL